MARRSIEVPGLRHGGRRSRRLAWWGNLLVSGGIKPGETRRPGRFLTARTRRSRWPSPTSGGYSRRRAARPATPSECTVFVQDKAIRPVVDKYWVEMFPDEATRPARHMLHADLQGRYAASAGDHGRARAGVNRAGALGGAVRRS